MCFDFLVRDFLNQFVLSVPAGNGNSKGNKEPGDAFTFLSLMDEGPVNSRVVDSFCLFVLLYAIHSAPKEELKKTLNAIHMKHVETAGESDPFSHPCLLDLITTSDLAYPLWQYFNSHKDWKTKLDAKGSENAGEIKWQTKTRFTSSKRVGVTEEGKQMYDLLLHFSRDMKSLRVSKDEDKRAMYSQFQSLCNKKAQEMGIMRKAAPLPVLPSVSAEDEAEVVEVDEVDMIPVDMFNIAAV